MAEWKLRSEMPDPEFDPAQYAIELKREVPSEALWDNHRFARLFSKDAGVYGPRKGNPRRIGLRRFVERFFFVKTKDGDVQPFILNDSQRRLLAEIVRMERAGVPVRLIILKARQQGFSTFIAALAAWYCLTRKQARACLVAHRKQTSQVIFGKVRLMIRSMVKQDRKRWTFELLSDTGSQIVFDEPIFSQIVVDSAEVAEPGRGDTVQFLHESESPSWKDASSKIAALRQILPSSLDTYGFCESTAKGDSNQFAREFKAAWKKSRPGKPIVLGWRAIFFPWYFDQGYRWSSIHRKALPPELEQDIRETLDEEEKALLETTYLRRGHGIVHVDFDQLAWRRYALAELCQRDLNRLHEEYPATPEEAFIASGARFFDPLLIKRMRDAVSEPLWRGEITDPEGDALLVRRLPGSGPDMEVEDAEEVEVVD